MLPLRAFRSGSISEGQRVTKEIHGRSITFLCHDGKVHALDSNCYHMGGPLGEGDIEELASGHLCIVCPWHKYRINLDTGGCVEKNLEGQLCSSAPKQRVYEVVDDSEYLWIKMSGGQQRESDKYNDSLQDASTQSSAGACSYGYGLGLSSGASPSGGLGGLGLRGLSASFSPARSSMSDEALGSQESSASTAYLEPFGGADKFYPPPSPLKPKAPSEARLEMRGRKAPNVRGAAARAAVMKKYKPPPMAVGMHELKPGAQRTITEMFSRVPQTPPAATVPEVHGGTQDMEM